MFLGSAIFALSAAHSASVKSERNFCMWLIENLVSEKSSQFSFSLYLLCFTSKKVQILTQKLQVSKKSSQFSVPTSNLFDVR